MLKLSEKKFESIAGVAVAAVAKGRSAPVLNMCKVLRPPAPRLVSHKKSRPVIHCSGPKLANRATPHYTK